jgi:hypothetical protein
MSGAPSVFRSLAAFALYLSFLAAGERGQAADAGGASLFKVEEGSWLSYKGTLKVITQKAGDEPEELLASLEEAYVGLGPPGPQQEVLLVRTGESPVGQELATHEAVTLVAAPGATFRAKLPLADRATRVSPVLFNHLPLSIFPALADVTPRQWRAPARLQVYLHEPRELAASHRLQPAEPSGTVYAVEADRGQKLSFVQNRVELLFEVAALQQVYHLSPREGRVLKFHSRLEGKVLAGESPVVLKVEVELTQNETLDLKGGKWTDLLAEARQVQEIERSLFGSLDAEGAQAKASAFAKAHPGSRLSRFAAGLSQQADDVAPIAKERRLYQKPAPDFTLKDLSGKDVKLSSILPGKITLLSFWSVG